MQRQVSDVAVARLRKSMVPEQDGDRDAASLFWETVTGDSDPSAPFLEGFAEGALEVWDEAQRR